MTTNLDLLKNTLSTFKQKADFIYTQANNVASHSQDDTNQLINAIFELQGFMDRVRVDYSACTGNICAKAHTSK